MNPGQDATSQTATADKWGGVPPARSAHGAEGAASADNATGEVPGFQPGFVLGVALFLALTGGVKLAAVLQESRLLGTTDPLLPWLTTRQMLFVAAGLELGVAAAVFHNRAARWAPLLILWLAAVFGAYRWGLWAVGFEGHCPCLGHLFARWAGFEAATDRLMTTALGVMGLGSVVCLAMYRRGWLVKPLKTGVLPTWLMLAAISLLLAITGRADVPLKEEELTRIGAVGSAKFTYLDDGRSENLRFKIAVEGRRVFMQLYDFSPVHSPYGPYKMEYHYDGELGFLLSINPPELMVPRLVMDAATKQPREDTNIMVRPANDATMEIDYHPIPLSGSTLPLWLAFASQPYLDEWSGGQMEKLFDLHRRQRRNPLMVPGIVKRTTNMPKALALLATLDPHKRTLTNELFQVEEWQSIQGQTWPRRFAFKLYQSHFEPKGKLLTVSQWIVEELMVPAAPVTGRPQFQGVINVNDGRFNQDLVPLPVLSYTITNAVVPAAENIRALPLYLAQVEHEERRSRMRPPRIWSWIFWPTLLVPLIWHLARRHKTETRQP